MWKPFANAVSRASNTRSNRPVTATADTPARLRDLVAEWRAAGERIALVPTMGDLHAGHLALVEAACATADRVVVSIFVNPLQFGPEEDFSSYPRVLDRDCERLAEYGVDAVFAPTVETLYPQGTQPRIDIRMPGLDDILCGAERPGHFSGVATVVAKLLNIASPDSAFFGEKDYQQLLIIRRLVDALDFPVRIEGVPTVREDDGLALSSRNAHLTAAERVRAPELYACLTDIASALARGETDRAGLVFAARERLTEAGFRPGYIEIRRSGDLSPAVADDPPGALRVLGAAHLGRARLIDNLPVEDARG